MKTLSYFGEIIENAVILSGNKLDASIFFSRITDNLMEDYILDGRSFQNAKQDYMRPIEKALVKEALKNSNQNITRAAELLGMKRQYLQQKIKKLNLNKSAR